MPRPLTDFISRRTNAVDASGIRKVFDLAAKLKDPINLSIGLPDFDFAARNYLSAENYTYYRNGASGEWTYRDNLEIYSQFKFRPRVMVDITQIESSLPTTLLGSNFSAPFFISPCARAELGHPDAEINFVKAAASENILYIVSGSRSRRHG